MHDTGPMSATEVNYHMKPNENMFRQYLNI